MGVFRRGLELVIKSHKIDTGEKKIRLEEGTMRKESLLDLSGPPV